MNVPSAVRRVHSQATTNTTATMNSETGSTNQPLPNTAYGS